MHYLIALLLALLSLLVVSYPLLKARQSETPSDDQSDTDNRLARNVESAFDEIDRLQMEFELGVIEPQDYQRQMDELRRAAAETLRAYEMEAFGSTDDAPTPESLDDLLEERIRLRRRALQNNNSESQ